MSELVRHGLSEQSRRDTDPGSGAPDGRGLVTSQALAGRRLLHRQPPGGPAAVPGVSLSLAGWLLEVRGPHGLTGLWGAL